MHYKELNLHTTVLEKSWNDLRNKSIDRAKKIEIYQCTRKRGIELTIGEKTSKLSVLEEYTLRNKIFTTLRNLKNIKFEDLLLKTNFTQLK